MLELLGHASEYGVGDLIWAWSFVVLWDSTAEVVSLLVKICI